MKQRRITVKVVRRSLCYRLVVVIISVLSLIVLIVQFIFYMKYNLGSVEQRLKQVFGSLGKLLSPEPESEMHDKTKGEWRNHLHMRAALLQQQLLTTRDKMNFIEKVKKLESDEDKAEFDVLKVISKLK